VLLVLAYRRGMLNPHRPIAFLILIYLIMTSITPFVQPRYNYFVYVPLSLEFAKEAGKAKQKLKPPVKNVPDIAGLNRNPQSLGF
jgi:asparagine N-glycosylation enzyme membrane subunit Stt3